MVLDIVHYGHPALRTKGRHVENVAEIRGLVRDMLDTMRNARGVGLAAQQMGRPLMLCVIDVAGIKDRPSAMWIDGAEVAPSDHMPLVLVNPEIETAGSAATGEEGCLSFPGIYSKISRPPRVRVTATDRDGHTISFAAAGLLARAILHEYDHLLGELFIDRMTPRQRNHHAAKLSAFLAAGLGIA